MYGVEFSLGLRISGSRDWGFGVPGIGFGELGPQCVGFVIAVLSPLCFFLYSFLYNLMY